MDMDTVIDILRQARAALLNVPCVGDIYDQQHSDTHLAAYLAIDDALASAACPLWHVCVNEV